MTPPPRGRVSRRTGVVALCAAAALAAVSACGAGGSEGTGTKVPGGSYSIGVPNWYIAHLTPGKAGFSGVADAIWTPLTQVGRDGKVVNAVAQSVQSTDQRHWTITLKSGWKFQNGEPVTAQSFADSWNAAAYAPNTMSNGYLFSNIDGYAALNPASGKPATDKLSGVQVVGTDTLKVTLVKPLSMFPYVLAGTAFAPMPKAAFKDLAAYDRLPIGNGPYQVAAPGLAPGGQQITLKRFDGYPGAKGKAAQITVKTYQTDATAFTSFRSGAVDIATASGNDLSTASRMYASQLVTSPTAAVVYLGFPLWDKRFTDVRVRQAFSLAVDRKAIVTSLLQGHAQTATGIAPDVIAGGGGTDCADCSYDPAKARQLLAAAGGWNGSLTLWTKQDPDMQTVLEAIVNQLRTNLGITSISLKVQPTDQIYPDLLAHKTTGPFLLYMGAAFPNIYSQADQLFGSASGTNVTGYKSAGFDALMGQAAAATSTTSGMQFAQQAGRTAMADLPLAPLYYPVSGAVHAKKLSGLQLGYLGDVDLSSITVR
ncbi:ABC transporter substrate-binding protein [Streptomyces cocklensis]|uniref:Oligopeptide ABC transporter, periplasmic oligopeptide-binding protein oppA (TC 3.A.1.5.1) n=1 Tax=Actinacidiphila cocklensis TaxID=887465 RepID=A0A9W4GNC6_9ACTN|nr:ABC transporter substrate-binding protein [Actinacidiphila cocklensis]MDD1062006.1 ABC transporter substrate-binding protein [Actinacidiphila cocklensis]CAG6391198.1 Oligopeptide ABC transporter, periplasmic oligopeptide-binding protein oppA (TC 3.A.1.5.1) [Actinacidiphila cocklensis]